MECPSSCDTNPTRWVVLAIDGRPGKHAVTFVCRSCGRRRLQLATVEDLEGAVIHVASRYLREHKVQEIDREEFVLSLTAEAWSLWLRWQPDRGVPFAAYLFRFLPLRANQYFRSQLGRRGHKAGTIPGGLLRDPAERDRLGAPPPQEPGDPQAYRNTDLLGVLGL